MRISSLIGLCLSLEGALAVPLVCQEPGRFKMSVSYVTTAQVYFDRGRDDGVRVEDTVLVTRSDTVLARAIISALSSHSSVGKIDSAFRDIRIGDSGVLARLNSDADGPRALDTMKLAGGAPLYLTHGPLRAPAQENIVSGRVALYWSGTFAADSRLNVNQPAALASLRLQNISGTGMTLLLSGREYSDLTSNYLRYGDSVRSHLDLYELKLERDRADEPLAFGLGRMNSRFIGGLGTFDGGQLMIRQGAFTTGALFGRGIGERAQAFGGSDMKSALFVGYRQQDEDGHVYDGSIAFGRLMIDGKTDRAFLSFQNALGLSTELTVSGNAEVDLRIVNNGREQSAFRLSSLVLFANYYPLPWLYSSFGYDGTRPITLLESSHGVQDSLIRDALMHGLRASITARVSKGISLIGTVSYRSQPGDPRSSHSLTGGLRLLDFLSLRANVNIRGSMITGPSFDAHDLTFELDRQVVSSLSVLLRYDSYIVSVLPLKQNYPTQTYSAQLDWRPAQPYFAGFGGGYVVDNTVNSFKMFFQMGIRFC